MADNQHMLGACGEVTRRQISNSPPLLIGQFESAVMEPSSLEFQPLDQDPRALIATEVNRHQGGWIRFEFQPQDADPMVLNHHAWEEVICFKLIIYFQQLCKPLD